MLTTCPHCNARVDAAAPRVLCPACRKPFDVATGPPPLPQQGRKREDDDIGDDRDGAPILPLLAWFGAIAGFGLLALLGAAAHRQGMSAPQQGGLFAEGAFWLILCYVGARAVDRVAQLLRRGR